MSWSHACLCHHCGMSLPHQTCLPVRIFRIFYGNLGPSTEYGCGLKNTDFRNSKIRFFSIALSLLKLVHLRLLCALRCKLCACVCCFSEKMASNAKKRRCNEVQHETDDELDHVVDKKRKTKVKQRRQVFLEEHRKAFPVVTKSKVSESHTFCTACRCDVSIAHLT